MAESAQITQLVQDVQALVGVVDTQQGGIDSDRASWDAAVARLVDLTLVDNTSDLNAGISTATQTALTAIINTTQLALVSGVTISTVNGESLLTGADLVVARSATSLVYMDYDDRSTIRDMSPEVDDSMIIRSLGLFMWVDNQIEPADDETCFNTDTVDFVGQWRLEIAAPDLLAAWAAHSQSVLDDWMEDEATRFAAYINNQT